VFIVGLKRRARRPYLFWRLDNNNKRVDRSRHVCLHHVTLQRRHAVWVLNNLNINQGRSHIN